MKATEKNIIRLQAEVIRLQAKLLKEEAPEAKPIKVLTKTTSLNGKREIIGTPNPKCSYSGALYKSSVLNNCNKVYARADAYRGESRSRLEIEYDIAETMQLPIYSSMRSCIYSTSTCKDIATRYGLHWIYVEHVARGIFYNKDILEALSRCTKHQPPHFLGAEINN